MAEMCKHYSIFIPVWFLALLHLVNAQNPDQSGFISLDCGLPKGSRYTERSTEINFISDDAFISSGVSKTVFPEYAIRYQRQMRYLRSFPEGVRNCYRLDVKKGTKYLIKAVFLYGNYDNQTQTPSFDLHIGANYWDTVVIRSASQDVRSEIIHTPPRNYLHICLVNTRFGTPFIQAITLRPLLDTIYESRDSIALYNVDRSNLGAIKAESYRYPDDAYDRGWSPYITEELTALTTNLMVESERHTDYRLPNKVMQTAAVPNNKSTGAIEFYLEPQSTNARYYLYCHFAELQPNETRALIVKVNGEILYGPVVPKYLSSSTFYNTKALTGESKYSFSVEQLQNSTLPPILNAVEFYMEMDFSKQETHAGDVDAITTIKSTYDIERNWNGDPCIPVQYSWTGLNCTSNDSPRISSLNLSSCGLTGNITDHFSKLTMIESLDLSNNSMTGLVPEFLAAMEKLKVLNLHENNFTGSIPPKLIERQKNGSLILRYDEISPRSCDSSPCGDGKKNNITIPLATSIGGLVFFFIIVATIFLLIRKKKNEGVIGVRNVDSTIEPRQIQTRTFTYASVIKMTNNFERVLGKGGFGTVYYGKIDKNVPVAIKVLSSSSAQGFNEFQAEVRLLVRVHHRNLTGLVGYCSEAINKALIYEFMANGNLDTHLTGDTILSWERRLQIGIDTALGLEYLHRGCKPPIVHRDVKTSNILLTENFHAKLSDFGLSKVFSNDDKTHVSTVVAGTPGYLDPEYHATHRLNEKSDVYSFGVVLLQLITRRPVFISSSRDERTHIGNWVTSMVNNGDITSIVDPRLLGDFDVNSAWKVVEVSMACLSSPNHNRPNMSQVVNELNECLTVQIARRNVNFMDSIKVISTVLNTDINPSAR